MIKAIVYTSNSGSTQKYARILGEELGLPVYSYKEARMIFTKEDEIIYMGWIMCGRISKYYRAVDRFNIKAVCAVGINKNTSIEIEKIKTINFIDSKFFYLRGAYNKENQHGIIKYIMKIATPIIKIDIKSNLQSTLNDLENLDMLCNGRDYVNKEQISEIIKWVDEDESLISKIREK